MAGSVTVGQVQMDLVVGLAKFKDGMREASGIATRETRGMAQSMRGETEQARGSLMLLSEEVGVHIPRHLQRVIAELPGVGAALSAAFSSVAVLAVVEIIAKLVEKIAEYRKHLEEAGHAWDGFNKDAEASLLDTGDKVLALQKQIDELKGNHVAALQKQFELLDHASLKELGAEVDKLVGDIDKSLDKLKTNWFFNLFTNENSGLSDAKDSLKDFLTAFDAADTAEKKTFLLNQEIDHFKAHLDDLADRKKELQGQALGIMTPSEADANARALAQVNGEMERTQKIVDNLKVADTVGGNISQENLLGKQAANLQEAKQAADELIAKLQKLNEAFTTLATSSDTLLHKEDSEAQKAIRALDDQIFKWQAFKAEVVKTYGEIKTPADEFIAKLKLQKKAIEDNQKAIAEMLAKGVVPGASAKFPDDLAAIHAKPVYTGGANAMEIEKIKKDGQEAQNAAEKVKDSIETVNEKYKEQLALLKALHDAHKLTDDEFKKASDQAKEEAFHQNEMFKKFGEDLLNIGKQAALMGRSWTDAFKAMAIELAELIIKMTLLKDLQADTTAKGGKGGGGGIGSMLSGVLSGVIPHAGGGDVVPGATYLVGEKHPELLTIDKPGYVWPTMPAGGGSGGNTYYNIQPHFVGLSDGDSFKRNSSQIGAELQRSVAAAHWRNR